MLPTDARGVARILAQNLNVLLDALPKTGGGRPELASRMGIGDKTLGFLKAGTGNPTLENIVKVARFFRKEPWQLLKPKDQQSEAASDHPVDIELLVESMAAAQRTFHDMDRNPSNQSLAAATVFVYTHAIKGKRMDEAADLVRKQIEKTKESAIDFTPKGSAGVASIT